MVAEEEHQRTTRISSADGPAEDLASLLDDALECLGPGWPAASQIPRRLRDLCRRLREGRLQLAVLGQFKRGKSTFLNALLGAPLLPTGIVPLTAVPTFIAWGAKPLIRAIHRSNRPSDEFVLSAPDEIRECLFGLVAEEANPRNRLDLARVELFYPSALLQDGVVLIDTPGIGSTHRHNTDAALQVLPECDAGFFVVSPDPPITEAEIAYLAAIRRKVARIFFVLSKADYLDADELRIAVEFLRKTLRQASRAEGDATVFTVSALAGLKAKQRGDAAALQASGLAEIESHLLCYLAQEKTASLRTAVGRKALELVAEAEADLSLRVRALEMPLEDLTSRSAALEVALRRIAGEERVIHDLLAGDRHRAVEQLEMHAERLRQRGRRHLTEVLEAALSPPNAANLEAAAQKALAAAIPDFFEQELTETTRAFGKSVEDILTAHQRRIDDLVNLVRRTAADLFAVPYAASTGSERFELGQDPYWVTQKWDDRLVLLPTGLAARLLPAGLRRTRLRAQLREQADELVQRNVENLRWATLQGLDNTFRRFSTLLGERLSSAVEATRGAVETAATTRSSATQRADEELAALRLSATALAEIQRRLTEFLDEPASSSRSISAEQDKRVPEQPPNA